MTRVGLGYVAMAAAGISVAVLGYAVIWAYGEPDTQGRADKQSTRPAGWHGKARGIEGGAVG
jgi:hypothetical protein